MRDRRLHKCHKRYGDRDFRRGGDNVNLRRDAIAGLKDAETCRHIENEIADWAGAEPGDVLIYPAPNKMNSKVAEVQVDWEGSHIRLADITDPILSARLRTIRDAHEQLWSVDLLVTNSMSEEQRSSAQYAFEARFLGKERARMLCDPSS